MLRQAKGIMAVLKWFDEVQAAGGYRKYYDGKSREGTLQGGGTAGGLGLDQEFFESALVPQVMLNGFLGFAPRADGFKLDPRLPSDWSEFTLDKIRYQGVTLGVRATREAIEIRKSGRTDEPVYLRLPGGKWQATALKADGGAGARLVLAPRAADGALQLDWTGVDSIRLEQEKAK